MRMRPTVIIVVNSGTIIAARIVVPGDDPVLKLPYLTS